jgi:hypothetical protein
MLTLAQATLSVKSFVKVADVRIVLPHARNEIAIFSSSVRIEPVPIREIEGLRSSRSYRDITEVDDGSAIHIRSQPLPPWLLFNQFDPSLGTLNAQQPRQCAFIWRISVHSSK